MVEFSECKCDPDPPTNKTKFKDCLRRSLAFEGKFVCYVKSSSNCSDTKKGRSAEACKNENKGENISEYLIDPCWMSKIQLPLKFLLWSIDVNEYLLFGRHRYR